MMKSVAIGHFPKVVVQADRFWLYNPILKKRYENRPEERVRLKWVEYLLHQTHWKKSRIGFESPVKTRQDKNTLRADLILHSQNMEPRVLIECKSERINITSKTAEQAAKYNSQVKAPYLVLTNGIEDFWFEQKEGEVQAIKNFFDEQALFPEMKRDFQYWQQRGFCSDHKDDEMKEWISAALDTFWVDTDRLYVRYLDFKETILPVPMNHHYKLIDVGNEKRLAVSFIGTDSSDTFIVAILNSKGVNKGIISVNLNKMQNEAEEPAILYTGDHKKTVSVQRHFPFTFSNFRAGHVEDLPAFFMNVFD